MSFHLDYLLDLPKVTVETCSCIENQFTLQLRIGSEGMNCPHCGQYTEELHQNRPILARDLSTFGCIRLLESTPSSVLLPSMPTLCHRSSGIHGLEAASHQALRRAHLPTHQSIHH